MNKKHLSFAIFLLVLLSLVIFISARSFTAQWKTEPIVPGPGVTEVKKLSDYFEKLKNTPGDSAVYILDSGKSGGTMRVMGGTHPTEPATLVAATLLVENAIVTEGKLIVVPHSNQSGFTWTEPGQGHAPFIHIKTDHGERYFRYGGRGTNPIHQWPDPDMYLHYPSGQRLAADEIRNLNRAHPGNPNGRLTQKIAYAFKQMIDVEDADIIIDQHEAPPEKPLVDAMAVHQRAMDLATFVSMELDFSGIPMRIEASPEGLHGFSHRELGDHTKVLAILTETSNPSQGSIRGRTDETLVLKGKDVMYDSILASGKLKIRYGEGGVPLEQRVGRDIETVCQFAMSYSEENPDRAIEITNLPSLEMLKKTGIGKYLVPLGM
jgi:predicted deacylase